MRCGYCPEGMREDARVCPHCGRPIKRRTIAIIASACGALLIVFAAIDYVSAVRSDGFQLAMCAGGSMGVPGTAEFRDGAANTSRLWQMQWHDGLTLSEAYEQLRPRAGCG